MITHLAAHPGPDPDKKPMDWAPLCGGGEQILLPWAITPHVADITCFNCAIAYWSGAHMMILSPKTPAP